MEIVRDLLGLTPSEITALIDAKVLETAAPADAAQGAA
jgi:hypothetical protein